MYRKLVVLLPLLIHLVAGGQIQDAAEEIDVPPAHRAAPPPPQAAGAAAPPQPMGPPLGPPLGPPVGSAPPPSYPLYYPAAWLPFGRFSASIPVQIVAG
ncbi:T-cell leukemia homeobox protein 3 [Drosophila biarmipes]|uniref:T-cell leukemia homeobox protein 3 n=1 Tax=Drosophila biarmipes TaxID=125945 RepID=UPI0007E7376F|nr:T-cell leukemia homeobox protein 3 [Drosophila biarmipes]